MDMRPTKVKRLWMARGSRWSLLSGTRDRELMRGPWGCLSLCHSDWLRRPLGRVPTAAASHFLAAPLSWRPATNGTQGALGDEGRVGFRVTPAVHNRESSGSRARRLAALRHADDAMCLSQAARSWSARDPMTSLASGQPWTARSSAVAATPRSRAASLR
jgi:hypothetical protein